MLRNMFQRMSRNRGPMANRPLVGLLPGGPMSSQIANPGGLRDSRGVLVSCNRATGKHCRKSLVFDTANLLPRAETVGLGWSPAGTNAPSVTSNAGTAPDGTMSASRVDFGATPGASDRSIIYMPTPTGAGTHVLTFYVMGVSGSGTLYANVQGTGNVDGAFAFNSSNWTRCTLVVSGLSATTNYVVFGTDRTIFPGEPAGPAQSVYLWGAKLETGSTPTPYISPMLVWLPPLISAVEPEGLINELASTNVLVRSQEFDNAGAWTKTNTTVTADQGIAPDGTLTADRIQINAGAAHGGNGIAQGNSGTYSGTTQTFSIWLRCASGTQSVALRLTYTAVADYYADVTVTTQWQRFSITRTFAANASASATVGLVNHANASAADVLAWGAQLEAKDIATSYYPTIASADTRAAEQTSMLLPGGATFGETGNIYMTLIPAWSGLAQSGAYAAQSDTMTIMYEPGDTTWATFIGSVYSKPPTDAFVAGVADRMHVRWNATSNVLENLRTGNRTSTTFASHIGQSDTHLRIGSNGDEPFWAHSLAFYRA